ncbi:MAG: hypothetical protein JXA07_12120 [Spirochaetes bacterium]|nr:hypothetical protein [Spirochaetota bacterium]
MTKNFTRPVTATERVYLANAEICPPFANQLILEYSGELNVPLWKKAVETASAANPGSRLVLKGKLQFARWVDSGKTPPVIEVDGSAWDGMSPEGAPAFLKEPMDPYDHTCEFIIIHGNPIRICLKTMHAVMDGKGTMQWLYDIVRTANGEQPIGFNSKITEVEAAKSFQSSGRVPKPHQYIAPTGKPEGNERGFTWRRIKLNGALYPDGLGQIAMILAREAWSHGDGPVRFAVPVDLRPRVPKELSLGNLTNFIYIDIDKESSPESLTKDVKHQLEGKKDGELYWGDQMVRYMPLSLLRRSLVSEIRTKNLTGLYRNSGIISNIGEVPRDIFIGGGLTPFDAFGIPPCVDAIPLFLGMFRNTPLQVFEIIISMPRVLANNGRMEALIDRIQNEMKPGKPK